jgi:hypothetical protein
MRLYLKLALIILIAAAMHVAVQPTIKANWEVQFAARCWLADQLKDERLQEQLVQEGQHRLRNELKRALEAPPAATANASSGR